SCRVGRTYYKCRGGSPVDVIVIGAGLGGLAAALAGQSAGHRVSVLERSPQLRDEGSAIGLPPNGVLALDALGLGEQVRARAATHDQGGGMYDRHGHPLLSADRDALEVRTGASLLAVRRTWLHGLLAESLAPGTVRTGRRVAAGADGGDDGAVPIGGQVLQAHGAAVDAGAGTRPLGTAAADHPGLTAP